MNTYNTADAFSGQCFTFTNPRAVEESKHCIMTFHTVIHSRCDGWLICAHAYEGRGGCIWSTSSTAWSDVYQEVLDFLKDNDITE